MMDGESSICWLCSQSNWTTTSPTSALLPFGAHTLLNLNQKTVSTALLHFVIVKSASWYEPSLDLLHSTWAGRPYHLLHSNCAGPSVTSRRALPPAHQRAVVFLFPPIHSQNPSSWKQPLLKVILHLIETPWLLTPSPTPRLHPVRRCCVLCLCDEDPRKWTGSVWRPRRKRAI